MSKQIGIKLADGTFYPVLEEGLPKRKILDLTTVQDNQTTVMVDLYRSATGTMEDAEYVDTLQISGLIPHPSGEPDLSLSVKIDDNDILSAEVIDAESGRHSDTTVKLISRTEAERSQDPDYAINDTEKEEPLLSTQDSDTTVIDESAFADDAFPAEFEETDIQDFAELPDITPTSDDESDSPVIQENFSEPPSDMTADSLSENFDFSHIPEEQVTIEESSETATDDTEVTTDDSSPSEPEETDTQNFEEPQPFDFDDLPEIKQDFDDKTEIQEDFPDIPTETAEEPDDNAIETDEFAQAENDTFFELPEPDTEEFPVNPDDAATDFTDAESLPENFDFSYIPEEQVTEEESKDSETAADGMKRTADSTPAPEPEKNDAQDFAEPQSDFDEPELPPMPDFTEALQAQNRKTDQYADDTVLHEDTLPDFSTFQIPDFDELHKNEAKTHSPLFTDEDFDDPAFHTDFSSSEPTGSELDFSGLYPDESEKEEMTQKPEKKKFTLTAIICIICAVICLGVLVGILIYLPTQINIQITRKTDANQLIVEDPAAPPADITALPQNPVQIEPEPVQPEPAQLEPEPPQPEVLPAEENRIVISETPAVIPAPPPEPEKVPEPVRYKLKWGDTLWDLAESYYNNPWLYKKIAKANNIRNPDYIIAGTYIMIPPK